MNVPKYLELPEPIPGYRVSWDFFNKLAAPPNIEKKDALGTLNFLTPERRLAAVQEVRTGLAVSLDLPLDFFKLDQSAFGGRDPPKHSVNQVSAFAHDDTLNFNTQSSSQWDGFRHFSIIKTLQYYNGYKAADFKNGTELGIHGGIFGRGVLIDFDAWAKHSSESINVLSSRGITLHEIQKVLEFQEGTSIRPGDILIFRTGWLAWYLNAQPTQRHDLLCSGNHGKAYIGLAQEPDLVSWLWDNQIAAVAGDQPGLECVPVQNEEFGYLHEHLIAALGCPIGELFNTEDLSKKCWELSRFTFLLTSCPLYLVGGVASPANATAIF